MKQLISSRFKYGSQNPSPHLSRDSSQGRVIDSVKTNLSGGELRLVNYDCPCGAEKDEVVIAEIDRYGLPLSTVVCMSCGTLRLDPYLDDASLENFYVQHYQQMYNRLEDLDGYFLKQNAYGAKILASAQGFLPPSGWVFEVGCGAGGALKIFQNAGYRAAGCDYSETLIAECKRRGLEYAFHGTLAELEKSLPGVKADLIYVHHVFEHLNDPLEFLQSCRERLAPGGRIIVVVPDVSRIDRFANPAGDLLVFLHIAHKFNFTFDGIRKLCARVELTASRLRPDPKMQTVWSSMPELWVEIAAGASAVCNGAPKRAGREMIKYLKRTERLYRLRLYKGRLSSQLKRIISRREPGRAGAGR